MSQILTDDDLRPLFEAHCECRPVDMDRESHSHDCDDDTLNWISQYRALRKKLEGAQRTAESWERQWNRMLDDLKARTPTLHEECWRSGTALLAKLETANIEVSRLRACLATAEANASEEGAKFVDMHAQRIAADAGFEWRDLSGSSRARLTGMIHDVLGNLRWSDGCDGGALLDRRQPAASLGGLEWAVRDVLAHQGGLRVDTIKAMKALLDRLHESAVDLADPEFKKD